MLERYCLTADEAAEMANIGIDDLMALIADRQDVGLRLDDRWRVDPDLLSAALRNADIRHAA